MLENSGTVEYSAGQSNVTIVRLTGPQAEGKWLKKWSLSQGCDTQVVHSIRHNY